jgi:hypothetical protein
MSQSHQLQLQRFELKYVVPESTALRVRDFVRSYLIIDEYGDGQPDFSYPVHSLYLDSDLLTIYWGTINGNKNRFKLRLRFYEDAPRAPVFFEIKRRMNDAILKQRGGVKREAVDWILSGHLPKPEHLTSKNPKELVAIQRFSSLMKEYHAVPKAHIAYMREAWVSPHDNSLRVTIDRHVRCCPEPTALLRTEMFNESIVFGNQAIVELKFTGRFPNWLRDLVRVAGLTRGCAAKYADGIALMGEHLFEGSGARRETLGTAPDRYANAAIVVRQS